MMQSAFNNEAFSYLQNFPEQLQREIINKTFFKYYQMKKPVYANWIDSKQEQKKKKKKKKKKKRHINRKPLSILPSIGETEKKECKLIIKDKTINHGDLIIRLGPLIGMEHQKDNEIYVYYSDEPQIPVKLQKQIKWIKEDPSKRKMRVRMWELYRVQCFKKNTALKLKYPKGSASDYEKLIKEMFQP